MMRRASATCQASLSLSVGSKESWSSLQWEVNAEVERLRVLQETHVVHQRHHLCRFGVVVQGLERLGLAVQGFELRVSGLGSGVKVSGFGVYG